MALIVGATKQKSFKTDRQIETQFARIIKAILGNHFIIQDEMADIKEGTDFMVVTLRNFKCGCRLRRFDYFPDFNDEFTIRWSRPSSVPTEIDKIRAGYVTHILYGFICPDEKRILQYFIGDLGVFNSCNIEPIKVLPNTPRDSDLAVYRLSQFPKEFVERFYINPYYRTFAYKESLRRFLQEAPNV